MKDIKSKNLIFLLKEHITWAVIAFIWYKKLLFRCIKNIPLLNSMLILLGLLVACVSIGVLLDLKRNRPGRSVFINLMIAYGIYTSLTYLKIRGCLIKYTLIGTAFVMATCLILYAWINRNSFRLSIDHITRYVTDIIAKEKDILGIGMSVIMICVSAGLFFGSAVISPSTKPASQDNIEEQTLANNMEYLTLLYEDTWNELTAVERLDVLQKVADVERRYLGIPHELKVCAANLDIDTLGCYRENTHEIIVDIDHLMNDSPEDIVDTICHEARHAYQHRLIDAYDQVDDDLKNLLIFYSVPDYKAEFSDYTDAEEDDYAYTYQKCEIDSRRYAKTATDEYIDRVYDYLNNINE